MLTLSRKDGERVVIVVRGEPVVLTVWGDKGRVRVGIDADRAHSVMREEIATPEQRALVLRRLGVELTPA